MGNIIPFPNDQIDRAEPSNQPNYRGEVYACKCLCVSWYLLGDGRIVCTACGATTTNMRTQKVDSGKPAA